MNIKILVKSLRNGEDWNTKRITYGNMPRTYECLYIWSIRCYVLVIINLIQSTFDSLYFHILSLGMAHSLHVKNVKITMQAL